MNYATSTGSSPKIDCLLWSALYLEEKGRIELREEAVRY